MVHRYRSRGRVVFACEHCGQNFSSAGLAGSHEDRCPDRLVSREAVRDGCTCGWAPAEFCELHYNRREQ